jgi:RNA 3'-terminal phosphate cyclase (ATP)
MRMSPSFHYLRDIWLPLLQRCGVDASIGLEAWGWFPVGRGSVQVAIRGVRGQTLAPLDLSRRERLLAISGTAVAANLPSHIPQRMAARARELLADLGVTIDIEELTVQAACPGAGLFLTAQYRNLACGFSALGERGKPAEIVADEAVTALRAHHSGPGVVDVHLADQLLVPMAIANGVSRLRVERVTRHLLTNAWVVERFGLARISVEEQGDGGLVSILPQAG